MLVLLLNGADATPKVVKYSWIDSRWKLRKLIIEVWLYIDGKSFSILSLIELQLFESLNENGKLKATMFSYFAIIRQTIFRLVIGSVFHPNESYVLLCFFSFPNISKSDALMFSLHLFPFFHQLLYSMSRIFDYLRDIG